MKSNFLVKLTYLSIGLISFSIFSQTQVGQDIDGEAIGDQSGKSVSLSSDGTILAIGAYKNSGNGMESGHVRVYENQAGNWLQIGQDIDGEDVYDQLGISVSLSSDGTILAIGANTNNNENGIDTGHVRVYENIGGLWTQVGSDINGESAYDVSGISVSLSSDGSVVAIGADNNDGNGSDSGHVRVYENLGGIWTQIGADIDGEVGGDRLGRSVSLSSDGSILAIGAHRNSGNAIESGHVRIYENQLGNWTQIGADIDGEAANDLSGYSISLSSGGTIIAIGAYRNDGNGLDSGHVRVYENIGDVWTQIGDDIDGEEAGDGSGLSVRLSSDGSILAVGAPGNSENGTLSGSVRVFKNNEGVWTQIGVDIDGEDVEDQSGHSLSLSSDGSRIAIGAHRNDGNGIDSGHVRVFDISNLLSIPETKLFNQITLYPNPTKNTLNIEAIHKIESIEIFNLFGQQILSSLPKTYIKQIDMTGLNSGMYIVKIIIGKKIATYKVVKE